MNRNFLVIFFYVTFFARFFLSLFLSFLQNISTYFFFFAAAALFHTTFFLFFFNFYHSSKMIFRKIFIKFSSLQFFAFFTVHLTFDFSSWHLYFSILLRLKNKFFAIAPHGGWSEGLRRSRTVAAKSRNEWISYYFFQLSRTLYEIVFWAQKLYHRSCTVVLTSHRQLTRKLKIFSIFLHRAPRASSRWK